MADSSQLLGDGAARRFCTKCTCPHAKRVIFRAGLLPSHGVECVFFFFRARRPRAPFCTMVTPCGYWRTLAQGPRKTERCPRSSEFGPGFEVASHSRVCVVQGRKRSGGVAMQAACDMRAAGRKLGHQGACLAVSNTGKARGKKVGRNWCEQLEAANKSRCAQLNHRVPGSALWPALDSFPWSFVAASQEPRTKLACGLSGPLDQSMGLE